jgi:hypothetical protein
MKKTLIALLLFFSVSTQAQYIPMLGPNVAWSERYVAFESEGTYYYYYDLYTIGDTLIEDSTYYKLFYDDGSNMSNAFIKETPDGKVFVRLLDNYVNNAFCFGSGVEDYIPLNEDLLLIDFSAELGDTLDVYYYGSADAKIVIVEVNIEYIAGEDRKTLWIEGVDNPIIYGKWIEGIGCDQGLFYSWCGEGIGVVPELLCYEVDNIVIYSNSSNCIVGIEEKEKNYFGIILSPNPTREKLQIKNDKTIKIKSLNIYSVNGKLILEQQINSSNPTLTIDVNQLINGIYLLEIVSDEGYKDMLRFIVEK